MSSKKTEPSWTSDELGQESSYEDETEMKRRLRRGDESKGDANQRDVAGDHIEKERENVKSTTPK